MLEVTVKTLDSQNHTFSVSEESTVKEFKEQISPVLSISVEKQRLIFCGKVLKDDKKLSEYDVNGKVIHVVQSLPPQGNSTSASSTSSSTSTTNSAPRHNHRDAAGFLLGAFTIPQDLLDPNQVQNIVQEVVSGMGELGRNATVISRNTEDGPSVDFRINLGQVPLQSEAQLRMNRTQTFFMRANRLLDSLEHGSNAGNNSSESSSQTDNDDEIRFSGTTRLVEADIGTTLHGESSGSSRGSGDSSAGIEAPIEQATESAPAVESVIPPQPTERYGLEGLAQVAQAALTAAIATATAAARAATSTLSPGSTPSSDAIGTVAPRADSDPADPTEISSEIHLAPVASASMEVDSTETGQDSQTNGRTTAENASQNSAPSTSGTAASGIAPREPSQPSVQTLANLLDEVIKINHRLEPCLEKCRDIIRSDSVLVGDELADTHRQFSKLSQLMHLLSHAYHSLSDLHINFASRPPRSPRVRIISSSPTIIQQAIPVQAQINITSSVISPTSNPSVTTTPSATTATTNTQNTSNDAPQPATRTSLLPPPDILSSNVTNIRREGSLPRIPSTSSIPAAMRGIQNPMYYMEVNPGSITIDSYMTAMDTSLGALHLPDEVTVHLDAPTQDSPATSTTTTQPSQPETRPESQTPEAQPSTPQSRNFLPPGFGQHAAAVRHLIPVPLTSMGSLQTFDSALPCHSVWALEPSRRRHHAGQSRATAESQRSGRPSAANASTRCPAAAGRAAQAADSQQPANETLLPGATLTAQSSASASTTAASAAAEEAAAALRSNISSLLQNINVGTLYESIPSNLQQALVGNHGFLSRILSAVDPANDLGQTIIVQDQRQSSRSGANSSSGTDSDPAVFPERYRSSVEELQNSSYPFRFTTLSDFLFDNREMQFQDDDIIGPLFYYLCERLTLEDFFEASLGNFSSFNKIKEPLLLYIHTKLFKVRNTEEQNKAVVDKIVENLMSLMEPLVTQLQTLMYVRPGVDYRATMRQFFKHKIYVLKNNLTIESVPDTSEFGNYICKMVNQIVLEFQYLHSACCSGGLSVFRSLFNDLIGRICTRNKASFRQVLRCLASSIITRETIPHVDPLVVRSFIVSTPEFRQRASVPRRAEASARGHEARENPPHISTRRSNLIQRTEELVQLLEQRTRSQRGILECLAASATMDDVVIGSENWHSAVPRDWVPVITRDVQRQRRQAPQSPFSDAYLSGMPSKRRKIMSSGTPALLENSKTTLTDMLQQAIASADVKPLSSSEQVKRDISENLTLQAAFTHHMKNSIQERLQQDLDFCSEKFPNAKKYYM